MPEWISVRESMPPPFQEVSVLWDNGTETRGVLCAEFLVAVLDGSITHWKPAV